jgi:broad specificity phosphatase PhoE
MPVLTYIRHAEQTSHNIRDPHIKPFSVCNFNYTFDLIVVSPYMRTRETAVALNMDHKPIYVDPRISEYLSKLHIDTCLDPSSVKYGPIPGYNESWDAFTARVDAHFADMKHSDQNVLIVAHGIVVKYLREKLTAIEIYGRGRNVPFVSGFSVVV